MSNIFLQLLKILHKPVKCFEYFLCHARKAVIGGVGTVNRGYVAFAGGKERAAVNKIYVLVAVRPCLFKAFKDNAASAFRKAFTHVRRCRSGNHNNRQLRFFAAYDFVERMVVPFKILRVRCVMVIIHYEYRHVTAGNVFRHCSLAARAAGKTETHKINIIFARNNCRIVVSGA